jgi:NADPH:quinone reductase-like Zn-dependent oxidoreductase
MQALDAGGVRAGERVLTVGASGGVGTYAVLERLNELVQGGKVAPVIDRVCPLEGVVEAMRDLEAGKIAGKAAIRVRG